MDRAKAIEKLRSFMEGREALEIRGTDGQPVLLAHERGYLTVKDSAGWSFVETVTDGLLDRLTLEAAAVMARELKDYLDAQGGALEVKDIGEVTGIALGSSAAGAKPGFPGARALGEIRPGETADAFFKRVAGGGEPINPFIGAPNPKKGEADADKYLDPARNPFIKLDPDAPFRPAKPEPLPDHLDPKKNPFI